MSLAGCHKGTGAVVCLGFSCGRRRKFIAIQRRHLIIASKSLRLFVVAFISWRIRNPSCLSSQVSVRRNLIDSRMKTLNRYDLRFARVRIVGRKWSEGEIEKWKHAEEISPKKIRPLKLIRNMYSAQARQETNEKCKQFSVPRRGLIKIKNWILKTIKTLSHNAW